MSRKRGTQTASSDSVQASNPGPSRLQLSTGAEPPPLFPPLEKLPPLPQLNPREQYLASKSEEIKTRFRYSPYYVEPLKAKREVEKFSDRIIQQTVKPKVYNLLKEFGDSFPYELLKRSRKKVDKSQLQDRSLFDELEKREAAYKEGDRREKERDEDEEEPMDEEEEDNDEFQDYNINEFDDDDEGVGSEPEDNEPVM
jgi:hypothetical protein